MSQLNPPYIRSLTLTKVNGRLGIKIIEDEDGESCPYIRIHDQGGEPELFRDDFIISINGMHCRQLSAVVVSRLLATAPNEVILVIGSKHGPVSAATHAQLSVLPHFVTDECV